MTLSANSDSPPFPQAPHDAELLFGVAQEVAWRDRSLPRGAQASPEHSHPCRLSYALKGGDGELIARIPLPQLQQGLGERRDAMRRLLRSAGITWKPSRAAWYDLQQINKAISRQPRSFMALIWAISKGQPYPRPAFGLSQLLVALLLLLCLLIPGLVYIALLLRRQQRYERDLQQLVKRWRAAGSPAPDDTLLLKLIDRPAQPAPS
ncbi:MAG: hypothetical protein AAFX65_06040 [Cyanobacteria bacterium J06638_7]